MLFGVKVAAPEFPLAVSAKEDGSPMKPLGNEKRSSLASDVIVIVNGTSSVCAPLVTRSVTVYTPGVVATPISPALIDGGNQGARSGGTRSETPGGSDPLSTCQL